MNTNRNVLFYTLIVLGAGCGAPPWRGVPGLSDGGADLPPPAPPGDGALPTGDAAATGMTIDQYCQAASVGAQRWCDYEAKCCSDADRKAVISLPFCVLATPPAECVTQIQKRIGAGTIEWHGEFAGDCILQTGATIPSPPATCRGLEQASAWKPWLDSAKAFSRVDACRRLIQGRLREGDECDYATDCGGGVECRDLGKIWKCGKAGGPGESCSLDSECGPSLKCIGGIPGRCGLPLAEGFPCKGYSDCAAGLLCDKVCTTPIPAGGSCKNKINSCEFGTGCEFLGSERCVRPSGPGASCTYNSQCDGRCDENSKRCVEVCGGPLY